MSLGLIVLVVGLAALPLVLVGAAAAGCLGPALLLGLPVGLGAASGHGRWRRGW